VVKEDVEEVAKEGSEEVAKEGSEEVAKEDAEEAACAEKAVETSEVKEAAWMEAREAIASPGSLGAISRILREMGCRQRHDVPRLREEASAGRQPPRP